MLRMSLWYFWSWGRDWALLNQIKITCVWRSMFWTPFNEKWTHWFFILSESDQELYIAFLNNTERWSLILINNAIAFENCKQQLFTLTMCLPACLWAQITRGSYDQGSYNQGFLRSGVLTIRGSYNQGLLQSGVLTIRGLTTRGS